MTTSSKKRPKASPKLKSEPHPWQPDIKVWKQKDLLYYDGPVVLGRVVEIPDCDVFKEELLLEISYHVGNNNSTNVLDPGGYVSVRWTKTDLREMLDLVEATEKELGLSKETEEEEKEKPDDDNSSPSTTITSDSSPSERQYSGSSGSGGPDDFSYTRPDWFSNACG